jgi:hypothetical protein
VILCAKSPNLSCWFLDLRPKPGNPSNWFWGQTTKIVDTSFEAHLGETIDLGFEVKPRNPCSLSPHTWCRPHTASSDLSIVQRTSTWPMLNHPWSSTPSLLLLLWSSSLPAMLHLSPTHHETSKRVSPHKTDSRVEPPKCCGFKCNPREINYSSQIKPR